MYNNLVVLHYAVYILISAVLTLWVGKALFKNGRIFLSDSFDHNDPLVDSVNHLVTVGFYLITFGIIALFLRAGATPKTMVDSIEFMSTKIGVVLLLLVVLHSLNIFGMVKIRYNSLKKRGGEAAMRISPDRVNGVTEGLDPEPHFPYSELEDTFDHDGQPVWPADANSTGA